MTGDLAAVQSAVASLLMEPAARAAFQANPSRFAKARGLSGAAARTIAGLDREGTAYFAERRIIDRFAYLRGDLPRSVAAVDAAVGLEATYFADHPYAFDEPVREVRQFQAWARSARRRGVLSDATADLCAIECAGALLLNEPWLRPKRSSHVARNPHMTVLQLRRDPDDLLAGRLDAARSGRFTTAIVRDEHDVEVYRLEPRAVELVKAATGKEPTTRILAQLAKRHEPGALRQTLADLRRLGVLTP